ncbi:MAG: hypothetical protein MMC23_004891 [Stictis urceolatum]|nr:hypothetical protein [Stictis urceolata]
MDSFSKAATNRSIRTIKTELDFLLDSNLLTPAQVSSIHALLPSAPTVHANSNSNPSPSPIPQISNLTLQSPPQQPPRNNPTSFYEKSNPIPSPSPAPSPAPPPAYNAAPGLATASALYAYNPTDAGDLALLPQDKVVILEYMNADWAKGRSERSGLEGIFPRSYVRVEDEKTANGYELQQNGYGQGQNGYGQEQKGSGYGNMPLEVSQGQQGQQGQQMQQMQANGEPSKVNAQGKKFGKKLGNAAIFGAGASIGSNIVNGIF